MPHGIHIDHIAPTGTGESEAETNKMFLCLCELQTDSEFQIAITKCNSFDRRLFNPIFPLPIAYMLMIWNHHVKKPQPLWICGRFNVDKAQNVTNISLLPVHLCFNCNFQTRYQSFECIASAFSLICCNFEEFIFVRGNR